MIRWFLEKKRKLKMNKQKFVKIILANDFVYLSSLDQYHVHLHIGFSNSNSFSLDMIGMLLS